MKRTFSASVWREEGWYIAQCLEIDVASQGESEKEALEHLREALELYGQKESHVKFFRETDEGTRTAIVPRHHEVASTHSGAS